MIQLLKLYLQSFLIGQIEKLQEFIDDYPNSDEREKAEADIKKLRDKLSQKAFESGVLYMKMEEYKAALLAKKAAHFYTKKTPSKPRFVSGSLGPTQKKASDPTDVKDPS